VNVIAARLYHQKDFTELARWASVPVINLLDDLGHPCQIMADFLTISEKKDLTKKMKISFFGDGQNNVTYELMRMCAIYGFDMDVACPAHDDFAPPPAVLNEVNQVGATTGSKFRVLQDPIEAAKGADIIYTDTWMSYHIMPNEEPARKQALAPFQVTSEIMKAAKSNA
jgi:ornithine carbamoyltransferase